MKKYWLIFAGLSLLAVGVLTGCSQNSGGTVPLSTLGINSQQQGIWVNGSGKVTAVPDIATITLGIQSQELTVADAQSKASAAMNKVIDTLNADGVAKKDIQTQNFNIIKLTNYDSKTGQQIFIGYQVTNTITAKIHDISKAGSIIDDVAIAGGDLIQINGINFSIEDPTSYYAAARKLAVQDAKAKAQQLADLAGVGLGNATYITENSYTPPVPSFALEAKASGVASTPINPGETDITSSVQITFAIK